MSVPNRRERQLATPTVTLGRMIDKRWIDKRDTGGAIPYWITDEGMKAKTTRICLRRSRLGLED